MLIRICGARGTVPSPGGETLRYGGNTSCVHVVLSDDTHLILDAGTGICNLPPELTTSTGHFHVLLTHLHLDHIQGLLFFPPVFEAQSRVTIWGPAAPGASLKHRIARYLSAPLTPVDVGDLPGQVDFRDCPANEWRIGSGRIRARTVAHRGPTLGFRIEDEDASLCYLPDHEPARVGRIEDLEAQHLSGYALARRADLLIHDCQYTDAEYARRVGWGHSAISHAVHFADRCDAARTLLFHHDPHHTDDELDAAFADARRRWRDVGRASDAVAMAAEGDEVTISRAAPAGRRGTLRALNRAHVPSRGRRATTVTAP